MLLAAILCGTGFPCAAMAQAYRPQPPAGAPDADDIFTVQAPDRNYSQGYTGAFVEYSIRTGLSIPTEAPYSGWNFDVGMRHSFPALLGDFRVAYRFDRLHGDAGELLNPQDPAEILRQPGMIDQHSLGGYLAIHPAYLLLLGNSKLAYSLASVHLELGFGAQYALLEPTSAQRDLGEDYRSHVGPFVSLGGGFSVPLTNPDVGYAPWLHFVYRWHVADFNGEIDTFDINMHVVQIGLGWRINGLLY